MQSETTPVQYQASLSPGAKILIVEDESAVRNLCSAALARRGFDLLLAKDGEEGLSIFDERQHEIDLVLSDVVMPKMDGIAMVRRIFERNPHFNVILMTGYSQTEILPEDAERLCSVLPKPFSPKQLVDAVERCLQYERDKRLAPAQ